MTSRTNTVLTITGITLFSLVAYAVYFDYKRRNDAQFRRQLRKEKKRVDKSIASSRASMASSSSMSKEALRAALEQVKSEEIPAAPAQREGYFMSQVGLGEQLAARGEEFHLSAAMSFFRALRVYPSPVELMVIYQKTVPEPIFNLVIELTNLDAKDKIEAFYEQFPPKSYNVSIVVHQDAKGKRSLVVNKDFKAGETIYQEQPVVTALDADLQTAGSHCSHCLRVIESSIVIKNPQDPLSSVYCSKSCQVASKSQSHSILFTLERTLPETIPMPPPTPQELENRRKAQTQFAEHVSKSDEMNLLLVARFIARRLIEGTAKLLGGHSLDRDYPDPQNQEYSLDDHMERLRFIDVSLPAESISLLTALITSALPTLESYIPDEQIQLLAGKMLYNRFGVCYKGGRDNRPAHSPDEVSRTPYGTRRQVGSAFYTLSSYLTHSCTPSARPSFSNGTAQLHLIATRDLKKGDELTVSYVDVGQYAEESAAACRERRRAELQKGWKFACQCTRCQEEAPATNDEIPEEDNSKVEESVERWES